MRTPQESTLSRGQGEDPIAAITPEMVFDVHPKIRWAGLANSKGRVFFMQMREGVTSLTPESNDRAALEIRAQYIIETVRQESQSAGEVNSVTINFEKFVEILVPLKAGYFAITVDKDLAPETYTRIIRTLRELEQQ